MNKPAKLLRPMLVFAAVFCVGSAVARQPAAEPFASDIERCIVPAAHYYSVNPYVLRAILKVESGLNPRAIGKNGNGSIDVGISQINSMHFAELAKYGVAREHLMDACVGTYIGAWHLGRVMAKHGNTWEGVAKYHSATPYFNERYQIMLMNELVRSGILAGQVRQVPPLSRPLPAAPRVVAP